MKILFFTKYGSLGASSRYRVYQYLPFLEAKGIECTVCPLLPNAYLTKRYGGQNNRVKSLTEALRALATQLLVFTRVDFSKFDLIFVQYEVFPYLPFWFESHLFATNRVVVDYDDASHVTYQNHKNPIVRRMLASKIPNIVQQSSHVIVANRHLAEWASRYNSNVTQIPTSVNFERYPTHESRQNFTNAEPVVVWIGTPFTLKYLSILNQPLQSLAQTHRFQLKVIGANAHISGLHVVNVPWDEKEEGGELAKSTVGVMPLTDDPWSKGKSALKLIQYMAAGLPVIASPVGANEDVVQHGINGFLATSDLQWVEYLSLLFDDEILSRQLGQKGRRIVEDNFSIQVNAPRLLELLHTSAQPR